jgi:hypothetical protein
MIGLIGRGDDPCVVRVREAAAELGLPHVLIDEDRLEGAALRVDLEGAGVRAVLRTRDSVVDLEELSGVYARALGPAQSSRDASAVAAALHEWLDVTEVPVMGRPASMFSNSSKPHQARLTLVTNDPEAVRAFRAAHGRIVFKSISGIRSIVREVDDAAMARVDRIRDLPTQFQARVSGTDVRVHVVGTEVFPTRIASTALDYRYAARDGLSCDLEPCVLAPEIEAACVSVATALDLPLAGIDLRIGDEAEVTCFEVNPMPAFSFYESHTGQPIAAAIAGFLAGHRGLESRHTGGTDRESEVA